MIYFATPKISVRNIYSFSLQYLKFGTLPPLLAVK